MALVRIAQTEVWEVDLEERVTAADLTEEDIDEIMQSSAISLSVDTEDVTPNNEEKCICPGCGNEHYTPVDD